MGEDPLQSQLRRQCISAASVSRNPKRVSVDGLVPERRHEKHGRTIALEEFRGARGDIPISYRTITAFGKGSKVLVSCR